MEGKNTVRLAAVSMVKDELDILPYSLPRMADQVDTLIIADNLSTDGTREYLKEFAFQRGSNIIVVDDVDPAYMQSLKMTALAQEAVDLGCDWVIPFDADEVWYSGSDELSIRQTLEAVGDESSYVTVSLYDHVATGEDPAEQPDPIARMAWHRRIQLPLPKVAFRPRPGFVIEMGNHGVRYPGAVGYEHSGIQVRHFPYRSVEQMARKAANGKAAYDAAGDALPPTAGQHWRDYGRFLENDGIKAIDDIFHTWFHSRFPLMDPEMIYDPCPVPMPQ